MNQRNSLIDPVFVRGMTQRRVSRRDAFRIGGLTAVGAGLAACGVSGAGKKTTLTQAQSAAKKFWTGKSKHGHVNFANWPLYIDTGHKTLKEFTKATGITVNYKEVIQDDSSWFAKISPQIRSGSYIGYDVMVVTDGFEFSELVALSELVPLNQGMLTNFYSNASQKYKHRSFDPGNTYSIPWASGSNGRRLAQSRERAAATAQRGHRAPVLRPVLHQRADQGRHVDHDGLVWRHLPAESLLGKPSQVRDPR